MKRAAILLLLFLASPWLSPFPALATVSSTSMRVTYAGNGVTTAFSVPFAFQANADLVVILRDTATNSEATQVITSNYTLTGAGTPSGGACTFLTAPATGKTVIIIRDPNPTQDLDLRDNAALPVEEIEKRLDKLTMEVQRLKDQAARSLHMSDGNPTQFDMTLPTTLTSNSVPIINSTGNGFLLSTLSASAADLSALTGGGNTTLHFHNADRDRANHFGTQLASTISNFNGAVVAADPELQALAGLVSAADQLPYFTGSGAASLTTLSFFMRTVLDDPDSATARATLGAAAAARVINTSGGITGGGDLSADRTFTIAAGAINLDRLQNFAPGSLLGFSGSTGPPTTIGFVGGQLVISSGQLIIAAGGVTGTELAADCVTSAKILNGTIVSADLSASAGITSAQILDGTLMSADLASNAGITGGQIANGTLALTNIASQSAATIVGRGSDHGTGAPETLTIGAGLTSAGGILAASGGAATITLKVGGGTVGGGSFNTIDASASFFTITESPALTGQLGLAVGGITTTQIADGTIVDADVSGSAAIARTKLALTNTLVNADHIDNKITAVKLSPTCGITNTQIDPAANIAGSQLSSSAGITSAQILDGTLVAGDLSASAGIVGGQISTLPNNSGNVSGDWTLTPVGNNLIVAAGKALSFTGQSGDVSGFSEGKIEYDTTKKTHRFRNQNIAGSPWYVVSSATANVGPVGHVSTLTAAGTSLSVKGGSFPTGTVFRYSFSGRLSYVANETVDFKLMQGGSGGIACAGTSGSVPDTVTGLVSAFSGTMWFIARSAAASPVTCQGGGMLNMNRNDGVTRFVAADLNNGGTVSPNFGSDTTIQPFIKFGSTNSNNDFTMTSDFWEVVSP